MARRRTDRQRESSIHLEGEHVAEIIRRHREALGLSMRGLAREAGVALRTIQRLERGELVVQVKIFARVLQVLRVDLRELFQGTASPPEALTLEELVKRAADQDAIPDLLYLVAQHWRRKK
jgi:transcriptional regulator with XRE-family HTH domain